MLITRLSLVNTHLSPYSYKEKSVSLRGGLLGSTLLVWPPHTPLVLFFNTPLIRAYRKKIKIMLSRESFPLDFGIVKSVPTQKEGKGFDKDTIMTGAFWVIWLYCFKLGNFCCI